jgi:AraC family transcriptional activator of pobA
MTDKSVFTLVNKSNGNLAFKVLSFTDNSYFDHLQRQNYYSVIIITKGNGHLKSDFSEYDFTERAMLFFTPYQPFMITATDELAGVAIQFHPDFFCIYKHQREVACHGVLFNNIYQPPFMTIAEKELKTFLDIIEQIKIEMQKTELAQFELLVSYLKIFLINASRIKTTQDPEIKMDVDAKEPFILYKLKNAIEDHYRTKHSASDYSDLLSISPKALGKITKNHFNKTLTHLIAERIIIEAKRELFMTSKAVKEIAYELGFTDEYYFSRFFKTNAEVSPQHYRETVGFARAEAN